jgi:peptidoglycan/LPS O-acetylase OafA/YrhL
MSSTATLHELDSMRVSNARSAYRPELNALRFFAFLCVFIFHLELSAQIPILAKAWAVESAGRLGVCLFFLLSAFLITDLLWKEQAKTGKIHLSAFYARRALRIWPLYFVFLALCVILGHIWRDWAISPLILSCFLLLAGNWYPTSHGWPPIHIAHLWSISVEEQFYLLIPALAAFGGKKAITRGSVMILIVSYLTLWHIAPGEMGLHRTAFTFGIWTNSFVQFQFFAAGCLLATLLNGRTPAIPTSVRPMMIVAGLSLWIAPIKMSEHLAMKQSTGAVVLYLLVLAGTLLLFLGVLGMKCRIPASVQYLGKISFGLYVYHEIAIRGVDWTARFWDGGAARGVRGVAALAVTVAVASLSYEYFEKPFLKIKERFTFVESRDVAKIEGTKTDDHVSAPVAV